MADDDLLEAQRHAEIVEQLRRISTGIETLHIQGERQLRMSASSTLSAAIPDGEASASGT